MLEKALGDALTGHGPGRQQGRWWPHQEGAGPHAPQVQHECLALHCPNAAAALFAHLGSLLFAAHSCRFQRLAKGTRKVTLADLQQVPELSGNPFITRCTASIAAFIWPCGTCTCRAQDDSLQEINTLIWVKLSFVLQLMQQHTPIC